MKQDSPHVTAPTITYWLFIKPISVTKDAVLPKLALIHGMSGPTFRLLMLLMLLVLLPIFFLPVILLLVLLSIPLPRATARATAFKRLTAIPGPAPVPVKRNREL